MPGRKKRDKKDNTKSEGPDKKNHEKTDSKGRLLEIIEVLGKHEIIKGMTPEKLRQILEDLGPTFVKIGQIMSMRRDILTADYCSELEKLRTDVKQIPMEEICQILESEYRENYKKIFRSIEETPLGSASIAQVHSAVLKDGKKVVIKVQRQGIQSLMARDIALLRKAVKIGKIASDANDTIDFDSIIDEMWQVSLQEMDFLKEAENIELFSELNSDTVYVTAPEVIKKYSTSKVLVMEYIDGIQIDDMEALEHAGYDTKEIALKLSQNYADQIIDDAFFHADPHPGNLRIRDGKIVWIDLGMMGKLSPRDREFIEREVKAIANNDAFELQDAIISLTDYKGKINHAKLYSDVDNMLVKYGDRALGELDLGNILSDLFDLARENGVQIPKGLTLLTRGIITVEGVLAKLDPDINIMQIMMTKMKSKSFEDLDIKRSVLEFGSLLRRSGSKTLEIPKQFSDFLKMMLKGQGKVNLELMGSQEPLNNINDMVNRIVLCITNAAVLLGSSLIATTDMSPKVFGIPLLGFLGYVATMGLSIILAWDILRSQKNKKK